ncbi:ATP-binding cassette domain-containing protein [Hyphomicrobium sp.]|uniref:ATP-binding cassette domain-containing protein n=1 Tax=Hyphomicrobium sp. TaxID=82 RepID=UPI0039E3EA94
MEAGLFPAVRDVSFDIEVGETFVIMGLSGSGKSTLLRAICQLAPPTYGSVAFRGENLVTASEDRLSELRRHQMGMVFQNYALLPHKTVLENVAFPLEIQGAAQAYTAKRTRELVQLVGLNGKERARPAELSGGQQQRVGIARSLAVDPELWLLDEPFSALDPLIRHELQDEVLRLQKLMKKTVVFITHDFDEAIRLANRVAIMRDGQVMQIGTPEEIVLNPSNEYVANFTGNVNRGSVITVRSIMSPLRSPAAGGPKIPGAMLAARAAGVVLEAGRDGVVVDEANKPIGTVSMTEIIKVLASLNGKRPIAKPGIEVGSS